MAAFTFSIGPFRIKLSSPAYLIKMRSTSTYLINLTFQFVNTMLISFLIIGYNFFLYLGALVIIFRLKSISAVLNDLRYHQSEMSMRAKRMILIECQEMHVEVSA